MAQYCEPPAELTEEEWEETAKALKESIHLGAVVKLRKVNNRPQRAGDLFTKENVRSRGQDNINARLRKAGSVFTLARVAYSCASDGTAREDRKLALVRKPKEEAFE